MDDAPVPIACFTQSEILEMENLFEEFGEETLGQEFCQDLATSFSASPGCSGNMSVGWKEVRDWFQTKQKELVARVTSSPVAPRGIDALPEAPMSNNAPQNSIVPRGDMVAADLSELTYEAKSSKMMHGEHAYSIHFYDKCAFSCHFRQTGTFPIPWNIKCSEIHDFSSKENMYDVAAFLTYRVLSSGELYFTGFEPATKSCYILQEARVRFSGFGNEEDEWVNVKKGIRKRSIPLEPSECYRVRVGDLVLCFQERSDQAVYCDAHIIEIQRRLHDIKGCRCIFVVRYDHDHGEVNLVYTEQNILENCLWKCSQTTPMCLRKEGYPCMLLDVIYFALCQEKVNLKRLCCRPTL
ncbi:Protein SAWADEE homeodomain-like 1 [Vitis vinifera]|uniref:Protein SAWADEE homeodomain-like 1 n=1 Tax=Vitis vinifera TaxID=29760 RepID=A0A438CZB0_VITVI|nr:Protein SAWADEE homeodomain-like 1 [Vitis vinifera]